MREKKETHFPELSLDWYWQNVGGKKKINSETNAKITFGLV